MLLFDKQRAGDQSAPSTALAHLLKAARLARVSVASTVSIIVILGLCVAGVIGSRIAGSKVSDVSQLRVRHCQDDVAALASAFQQRADVGELVRNATLTERQARETAPGAAGAFQIDHTVDGRIRVRCIQDLDADLLRAFGGVPGGRHLAAQATIVRAADGGAPKVQVHFGALP